MRAIERAKFFAESVLPFSVRFYRHLRKVRRTLRAAPTRLEEVFSDIYRNNSWADPESVSGRGSTLARTNAIRSALPRLLESLSARSLLDAPCGDFNWMRRVALGGVKYIGADVVPELVERNRRLYGGERVEFVVLDITRDELPRVDAILCRDCFIHLSFAHARAAVANFKRSGAAFLLATTHTHLRENADTESGGWRSLNLRLHPFNFPKPAQLIVEDAKAGKCLGVWRLEEL